MGPQESPFFYRKSAKKPAGGSGARLAGTALEAEMTHSSAAQAHSSGQWVAMKGEKASLAQRFVGRHTGRAALAGAAGEAKAAKKANGARERAGELQRRHSCKKGTACLKKM